MSRTWPRFLGYGKQRMKEPPSQRSLPEDVWLVIFMLLDLQTLMRCKQVRIPQLQWPAFLTDPGTGYGYEQLSRSLCRLISNDLQVQCKIELALNGLLEGPMASRLCSVEKLKRVKEFRDRFLGAKFQFEDVDGSLYLGRSRLLMGAKARASMGGFVSYRSIVGQASQATDTLYLPPSSLNETPSRRIAFQLHQKLRVVVVDPSQDLLIAYDAESLHEGRQVYPVTMTWTPS